MQRKEVALLFIVLVMVTVYVASTLVLNRSSSGEKPVVSTTNTIIIERSGNMTGRMPVNITASYDIADSQIKEKILDALTSDSYSDYSSLKSKVFDIINNGGDIIEINVYLENNSSETLVLVTGGPDCFGPGFTLHNPIDLDPVIRTEKGKAVDLIALCQLALVKEPLIPGHVIHTTYYLVVSNNFKGEFLVDVTVCDLAGHCITATAHIPIDIG